MVLMQHSWGIIAPDFYQLIHDFHSRNVNIQSINYSFITLIPKVDVASCPADFRPISLLNCTLKIITKLLANRLQKVILQLVHTNQYEFLNTELFKTTLLGLLSVSINAINPRKKS